MMVGMLVLMVNLEIIDTELVSVHSFKLLLKYINIRNSSLKALVLLPTFLMFPISVFIVCVATVMSKAILEQSAEEWKKHKYFTLNELDIVLIISVSMFVMSEFILSLFLRELIKSSDLTTNSSC